MSTKAGQLLWNRVRLTLPPVQSFTVDTGLTQLSKNFDASSLNEPTLGGLASRVQVIPLLPIDNWTNVSHGEPYLLNGTVHVDFTSIGEGPVTINVLFWDPHTVIGPGNAQSYNPNIT